LQTELVQSDKKNDDLNIELLEELLTKVSVSELLKNETGLRLRIFKAKM